MIHPFNNKLFAFIGTPERCTRREVINTLMSVGGVYDDRISEYTHYVVAFKNAEGKNAYSTAYVKDKHGHLILLTERQFFNIIEGKANPPEKKKPASWEFSYSDMKREEKMGDYDYQIRKQEFIDKKREMNQDKYYNYDADECCYIMKISHLMLPDEITKYLNKYKLLHFDVGRIGICDKCGNQSTVFLSNENSKMTTELCKACYNRMMATIYNTDMPALVPRKLPFRRRNGTSCEFRIEFMIFATGKKLTATEIGNSKRIVEIFGDFNMNFDDMMNDLKRRVKKALSVQYIDENGQLPQDKIVGYISYDYDSKECSVVIDGKPYKWKELEDIMATYEMWQIKIEIHDMSDEID